MGRARRSFYLLKRKTRGFFEGDLKFRTAYLASVLAHAAIFVTMTWVPSESNYRFYGSGTAVTLVGAHQIPGGSARGRSGDREEARRRAARAAREAGRKLAAAKKKRAVRPKPPPAKNAVALKRKKQPTRKEREREARLREIRERRERERRFRERFYKKVAREEREPRLAKAERRPPREEAKPAPPAEPPRPLVGHPGEGGGDGQGGGSLGGGSGGASRTHLERYFGLLSERVRSYWTVAEGLANVENLRATVIVDVAQDGSIRNLRLKDSSGNPAYDSAALRAVTRAASPSFPVPPNTMKERWLLLGFRFCGRSFCR